MAMKITLLSLTAAISAPLGFAQTDVLYVSSPPAGVSIGWGARIGSLSDVDGDGVPEWFAGIDQHGGGVVATVHSGATGTPLLSLVAPNFPMFFGQNVACVGDVSGDSVADYVLVGSRSGAGGSPNGYLIVNSGVDGSILQQYQAPAGIVFNARFQGGTLLLDDADGDDRPDLLVRTILGTNPVSMGWSLFSSATGQVLFTIDRSATSDSLFTRGAARLSDHDGDGRADFGLLSSLSGSMRLEVHSGATGALLADLALPGALVNTGNGEPLLGVQDADGDGLRDVALGGVFSGFVGVYSSATGQAVRTWDCSQAGSTCFGSRLIETGDLDGDGAPELLALESTFGNPGSLTLFGLSHATGATLLEQDLPQFLSGYTNSDRLLELPGADPLGFPTFALFDESTGTVQARRFAPELGRVVCKPDVTAPVAELRARGVLGNQQQLVALELSGAPSNGAVLLMAGQSVQPVPFGTGRMCVGGRMWRLPIAVADAAGRLEVGIDPGVLNALGGRISVQGLYRDGLQVGIAITNALELRLP